MVNRSVTNANNIIQEAFSLEKVIGKYQFLLICDGIITEHRQEDERISINTQDEYCHCEASIVDDCIEFTTLPYRPSHYPTDDIKDLACYHYDDGKERKLWAIKDAGNGKAHLFFKNNQTHQRLIYQCVDLGLRSIHSRITDKIQKNYYRTNSAISWDFDSKQRELIENN